MKYSHISIIVLSFVVLLSCQDDDNIQKNPEPAGINLKALTIGQSSKFIRITGVCGWAQNYEYSGDTLILEVTEGEESLIFKESFTEGSPLFEVSPDPVTYPVIKSEDMIMIPERDQSTLFFFYGNDTIHTAPTHEVNLIMNECDQFIDGEPFTGDQIGLLEDFQLHDIALQNQTVVSCVPIIIDLKAFLMYRDGKLNMSYTLNSGFPGLSLSGWKLIE